MSFSKEHKKTETLAVLFLGIFSLAVLFWHSRFALGGWYLREDARFFSVGAFSLHDLLAAFTAPMNSMGQYRPITRLLWALPSWLGLPLPASYHVLSVLLVAGGGFFLAWFCRLWFGRPLLAAFLGAFYALLPVHAKALHWISAWHNPALVLFFFAAMVFRVRGQRWLCLASVFLALASREAAFVLLPVLFYIDRVQGRPWARSLDFSLLLAGFGFWLFVWHSPFAAAGVQPGPGGAELLTRLARYAESAFFTANDLFVSGPNARGLLILALLLPGVFVVKKAPRQLAGTVVAAFGILPFLFVLPQVEYAALFAAGVLVSVCGLASLQAEKVKLPKAFLPLLPFASALFLALLAASQAPLREFYRAEYVAAGLEARRLVGEIGAFAQSQPPWRLLVLEGFGPHRDGPAKMSLHLLSEGLDDLLPAHAFAITHGRDHGAPFLLRANVAERPLPKGSLPPVFASFSGSGLQVSRD